MRAVIGTILLCALSTLAMAAPPLPGKDERCAVCGMFVAPFSQWVSVLELRDGRRFYFDGPKDLFIAFFDPSTHLAGVSEEQISGVFVTEYYTTRMMPASEVLFVTGSNVLGPMGQELVPIAGREAAETFRRDHAGQKVMRLDGRQLVELKPSP